MSKIEEIGIIGGNGVNKCEDCIYYDDTLTFPGQGWCQVWKDYVNGYEDYECDSWEEAEDD